MLIPIGQHLINEDDAIYIAQIGNKIRVKFRNGEVINIDIENPKTVLQEVAVYLDKIRKAD